MKHWKSSLSFKCLPVPRSLPHHLIRRAPFVSSLWAGVPAHQPMAGLPSGAGDAVGPLGGGWLKQPIHKEKSTAFVFPKPLESEIRGPAVDFDPEI